MRSGPATIMFLFGCIFITVAVILWFMSRPLFAHDAATGWAYDTSCCSGMDCHSVEPSIVRPVDGGWLVEVNPGDHFIATQHIAEVIPYDDKRVRRSQDQDFHVCIKRSTQKFLCIYVPEMGA